MMEGYATSNLCGLLMNEQSGSVASERQLLRHGSHSDAI
jgi:hypothetical protein